MKDLKIRIGKFALGSMLALGLVSKFTNQEMSTVYAASTDEVEDDLIKFTENGKKLQLVNVRVGDTDHYEKTVFGYLYVYNNSVYLEDKINDSTTNLSELDSEYGCQLVYTDAKNVIPTELKENEGITKEQATEISNRFQVITVEHKADSGFGISYFYTETFSAPGFDSKNLPISNYGIFGEDDYNLFFGSLYDEYLLQKEKNLNPWQLELGQEESALHAYYETAYQTEPSGFKDESGILLKYYALNKEGEIVASLGTQEEVDEFLEMHQEELDNYQWKAAFYKGNQVDEMLDYLQNNQEVPSKNITYFIDYKLPSKR